jgi:predicted small lipoprotein YifL
VSTLSRNAVFSLLLAGTTLGCGQQGPLVLPEQARPVERLESPPAAEPTAPDDEQQDER